MSDAFSEQLEFISWKLGVLDGEWEFADYEEKKSILKNYAILLHRKNHILRLLEIRGGVKHG